MSLQSVVTEIEDAIAKGVTDVTTVKPLLEKAIKLATEVEPFLPAEVKAPVAAVLSVLEAVDSILNKV